MNNRKRLPPEQSCRIRLMWVKDSSAAVMRRARRFLTFRSYSPSSWKRSLCALWPRFDTVDTTVEFPSCTRLKGWVIDLRLSESVFLDEGSEGK